MKIELICIFVGIIIVVLFQIIIILKSDKNKRMLENLETNADIEEYMEEILGDTEEIKYGITKDLKNINANISNMNSSVVSTINQQMGILNESMLSSQTAQRMELNDSFDKLRRENKEAIELINDTVNEKLQKTLDDKVSKSFETISEQLANVYKGIGEMKDVATGVNDLKNVLSNVKTKGILGEYQLEAILQEILTPEQYKKQSKIIPDNSVIVDFAIKLPGTGNSENEFVYLPIDSKFPSATYEELSEAYEKGNLEEIKSARKSLSQAIKKEAKSIHDKYIIPPYTTDFAVMFLPFEGLYSEVVNMGLLEELQNSYKINIAGPSTMAAMLNSFRMGFRTLAIQKRSGEVWNTLEAVKKEFETFEEVLNSMRKRLKQADSDMEKLIGARTNAINRKLKEVGTLESLEDADKILDIND